MRFAFSLSIPHAPRSASAATVIKYILSKFEIINNSNQDMYFALPRFIYSKNDSEKIDNIIILVMDQVDQKFFQSLEEKGCLKNIVR